MRINKELRNYFDELVDEVVGTLPDDVQELLAVVPIFVEDQPTARTLREMEIGAPEELQGLYTPRPVPMIWSRAVGRGQGPLRHWVSWPLAGPVA